MISPTRFADRDALRRHVGNEVCGFLTLSLLGKFYEALIAESVVRRYFTKQDRVAAEDR